MLGCGESAWLPVSAMAIRACSSMFFRAILRLSGRMCAASINAIYSCHPFLADCQVALLSSALICKCCMRKTPDCQTLGLRKARMARTTRGEAWARLVPVTVVHNPDDRDERAHCALCYNSRQVDPASGMKDEVSTLSSTKASNTGSLRYESYYEFSR